MKHALQIFLLLAFSIILMGAASAANSVAIDSKPLEGFVYDPGNPAAGGFTVAFTPSFDVQQYTIEIWKGKFSNPTQAQKDEYRAQIASGRVGVPKGFDGKANNQFVHNVSVAELGDSTVSANLLKLQSKTGDGYYLRVEVTGEAYVQGKKPTTWVDSDFLKLTLKGEAEAQSKDCLAGSNALECLAYIDVYKFSQIFAKPEPPAPVKPKPTELPASQNQTQTAPAPSSQNTTGNSPAQGTATSNSAANNPAGTSTPKPDLCIQSRNPDGGFLCKIGQLAKPFEDITIRVDKITPPAPMNLLYFSPTATLSAWQQINGKQTRLPCNNSGEIKRMPFHNFNVDCQATGGKFTIVPANIALSSADFYVTVAAGISTPFNPSIYSYRVQSYHKYFADEIKALNQAP